MPEAWQLTQMQGLPLELKVRKTILRIREWYEAWDGDVYTSFSGGIDSTVLKDIVDGLGLNIPSVFVDTGLEYPEVRNFARSQSKVTVLHPSMNFRKVIMEYGYPVVSKEVARVVREAKIGLERNDGSYAFRIAKLNGTLKDKNGNPSKFNMKKWKFLLDAPFDISEKCCKVMKKDPCKEYEKKTGRKPIIGTMAEESGIRRQRWIRHGCNAFEGDRPASNPLSFWTHKDILLYIVTRKLPYASVYGQIRAEYRGQVIPPHSVRRIMEVCPALEPELKLYNTGVPRTGCMFCMFGCHLEKTPNRFQRMQETHPNQWKFCMKPVSEGGLGEREVLEFLGVPWRKEEDDGQEN